MVSDEEAIAAFDPEADREAVYDAEVQPLVERIAEVCRARGIPFLMTFNFAANVGGFANAMMVLPGAHPLLHEPARTLYPVDDAAGAAGAAN